MPRVLTGGQIVARREANPRPLDHPRNIASAWRDGRRNRRRYEPDPWLWEGHPATVAAYMAGRAGEPRPDGALWAPRECRS